MNPRIPRALAAALASSAVLAIAQVPATPGGTTQPTPTPKPTYAQEPIASTATGSSGPQAQLAASVVEALNADQSLRGSKVSVAPTENGVLVTGVTPSLRQMTQVLAIATQRAGEGKVIAAISSEELVLDAGAVVPDPQQLESAEQASADSERAIAARQQQPPQGAAASQ